jgi:hypothetical protein
MNVHSKYYPLIDALSSPPLANYQIMHKGKGKIGDTPEREKGEYPWKIWKSLRKEQRE